jgi:uracil-DNA glycosylase
MRMALDEAALDMLGLAPLWARRGARTASRADGQGEAGQPAAEQSASALPSAAPAPAVRAEAMPFAQLAERDRSDSRDPPDPRDREADALLEAFGDVAMQPSSPSPTVDRAGVAALGWEALEARVAGCEQCRLCEKRTRTVFGVGDREADWMLIGEAPGENEDKQGEPFVGQAGKLLDSMLRALALARGENVYIANVVKCRPPGNRNPEPDEVARCEPYLQRQVALVKPKLIVALGRVAAQNLLKTDASISSLRGRVHRYEGVPVVVTYHPAYLLRSLPDKAKAWADLCLADDTYRQALSERAGE